MANYVIEDNVPFHQNRRYNQEQYKEERLTLMQLKVGQSFSFPEALRNIIGHAATREKGAALKQENIKKKFVIRKQSDTTARIWRIQ